MERKTIGGLHYDVTILQLPESFSKRPIVIVKNVIMQTSYSLFLTLSMTSPQSPFTRTAVSDGKGEEGGERNELLKRGPCNGCSLALLPRKQRGANIKQTEY